MDEGSPLIYSQRNRRVTIGDRAVELFIYTEDRKEWILEVVTHEDVSWVWDETFASDADADAAFTHVIETSGLDEFYRDASDDVEDASGHSQ